MKKNYILLFCIPYSLYSMQSTLVTLKDKSTHPLSATECASSTVVLQKKLLRTQITCKDVQKWGYSDTDYEQLQKMPLSLKHIDTPTFELFKKFLPFTQAEWRQEFAQLSLPQQDTLLFIASDKGLGVAQFIINLCHTYLLPELIQAYISPYIHINDAVNYIRNAIIVDHAKNNMFEQKKYQLLPNETSLQCNDLFNCFMKVPQLLIKNDTYRFCGSSDNQEYITFEDKSWKYFCFKKRNNEITYHITSSTAEDELDSYSRHEKLKNERMLWATDKDNNVIYKRLIKNYKNKNFISIKFSPNAHYLAINFETTDNNHNQCLSLITLATQQNYRDHLETLLPTIQSKNLVFCFNEQSTILAINTHDNLNIITLWDTQTGKKLSSLPAYSNMIRELCFNNDGTKILAIYNCNNTTIFDTSDYTNIKIALSISRPTCYPYILGYPYFNSDDTQIIINLGGKLLFCDAMARDVNIRKCHFYDRTIASTLNHDNTLLASAALANRSYMTGNTKLWNPQTGELLATILSEEEDTIGIRGVGFSSSERCIITTGTSDFIITQLYNKQTRYALLWLKNNTSLLQRYALYCVYTGHQAKTSDLSAKSYLLQQAFSDLPENTGDIETINNLLKYLSKKPQ